MPRKIEGEKDNSLTEFHRGLPIIIESEPGYRSVVDLAIRMKEEDGLMKSVGALNLALQSLHPNSRRILLQAIWSIVEATARQDVPPLILEIDRFGRPIERSRN